MIYSTKKRESKIIIYSVVISFSLLFILLVIYGDPVWDIENIMDTLYFFGVLFTYQYIIKLDSTLLTIGWGLIVIGFFMDFLNNFAFRLSNWVTIILAGFLPTIGIFISATGFYILIKEIREKQKEIEYLSFHDGLTDLYNRRYFEEELKHLELVNKLPISVIIIDIDNLKNVNDNLGHKEGDELIIKTAAVLKSVIRDDDTAARIGGDEFALIIPGADAEIAEKICRRIHKECRQFNSKHQGVSLSVSTGYEVKEDQCTRAKEGVCRSQ